MKKGKEYELLIEQIYKELQKETIIKQDDHLTAYDSGGTRQIDLSIRYKVANVDILIIVQAKDFSRKAEVRYVNEFMGVIKDVRADRGILICNMGFTAKAIKAAVTNRISLYSAHTTQNLKWHKLVGIPVFLVHNHYNYTFDVTLKATFNGNIGGSAGRQLIFKDGNQILKNEDLINKFANNTKLIKDRKEHSMRLNTNIMEVTWGANPWCILESVDLMYNYTQTVETFANINPTQYRMLQDYISGNIQFSFVDIDLAPLLTDRDLWIKKPKDSESIKKSQHMVVTIESLGNVSNITAAFYSPK